MGYILENLDLDEIGEDIIEYIVEKFSDLKLSNEDMLKVIGKVEDYLEEAKQYIRESEKGE